MEVIIKERTYPYTSDYPDGWHFSKGDYFKFPVEIGIHKCFIKRFKTKSPENISGWKFLENIRGKYAANLPRVHDIVHEKEFGSDVYYVFYEFIDGETLHHLLGIHGDLNFERLSDDLFSALQSLHKAGFWFPDFDERNIFCNRRHMFYLVDLDSAQPLSLRPGVDMWGNRDYWVLVLEFYKRLPAHRTIVPSDIPGDCLNYLQVIFLLLRLRFFYADKEQDYSELFGLLPEYLDRVSPRFRSLFERAINAGSAAEYIDDVKSLIKEEIFLLPESRVLQIIESGRPSAAEPVIRVFTIKNAAEKNGDDFVVIRDHAYTISWDVANASNIELYEDEVLYRQFTDNETSVEIKPTPANKDSIQYTLLASEGPAKVTSEPLVVHFEYNTPVIHDFTLRDGLSREADTWLVNSDHPFELGWNVRFGSEIRLFRNGILMKTIGPAETAIQLSEAYDANEPVINYELVVANPAGVTTRESVSIKVNKPAPVIVDFFIANTTNGNKQHDYESGESFVLQWTVLNARRTDVFRDGVLIKSLPGSENRISLVEQLHDRDRKTVSFSIKASNGSEEAQSNTVQIHVARRAPVIHYFKASKNRVGAGKPFVFHWEVEHANTLTVHRNGDVYVTLDKGGKQLELSEELADGHDQTYEYALVAGNQSTNVKSDPVFVTIQPAKPRGWEQYLKYAALFFILVFVAIILNRLFSGRESKVMVSRIEPAAIYVDSSISIIGDKLSTQQNLQVVFGQTPGDISSRSNELLVARVPEITMRPAPDSIRVNVMNKGEVIHTAVMPYFPVKRLANVSLPDHLDEIWTGPVNSFVRLDLGRKAVFIATGGKASFEMENIVGVHFENATSTYHLVTEAREGFRMLKVKDVGPDGFKLSVCTGLFNSMQEAMKANCINYRQMRLYYDSKPGVIYLPASNRGNSLILEPAQQQKLDNIFRGSRDSHFDVTLYHASTFQHLPGSTTIDALLQRPGKQLTINQAATAQLSTAGPFQRNFLTVVARPASADPRDANSPDCSRTFTSLNQVRQLNRPLVVCKLNLARAALTTIPREVYGFKNMKLLNLGSNPIPPTEIAALKQTLPGCKIIIETGSTPATKPTIVARKDLGFVHFDSYNELDGAGKSKIDRLSKFLLANPQAKVEFRTNWNYGKPDDSILAANITFLKNYFKSQGIGLASRQIDIKLSADPKLKKSVNSFHLSGVNFSSEF